MNSFIGWIGGKKLLRNEIIKLFPEKFNRYIEVFGGAAWVLFGKENNSAMEVYNDADGDLVNLFRCVKYHCGELQRELSFMLNSRELFYDFANQYNVSGMTDIQKAARFFMLIKTSYGADHRSYGCVKRDVNVAKEYLTDICYRLSKVVIENKDFEDLIKVYDKPDALLYLDPPYYGTEKYYQAKFSQDDHIRLNKCLKNINGKFILSYNNCDYIKELYKDFNIKEVVRNHNLTNKCGNACTYNELIITNY
jgi:DNA adenine methylase